MWSRSSQVGRFRWPRPGFWKSRGAGRVFARPACSPTCDPASAQLAPREPDASFRRPPSTAGGVRFLSMTRRAGADLGRPAPAWVLVHEVVRDHHAEIALQEGLLVDGEAHLAGAHRLEHRACRGPWCRGRPCGRRRAHLLDRFQRIDRHGDAERHRRRRPSGPAISMALTARLHLLAVADVLGRAG